MNQRKTSKEARNILIKKYLENPKHKLASNASLAKIIKQENLDIFKEIGIDSIRRYILDVKQDNDIEDGKSKAIEDKIKIVSESIEKEAKIEEQLQKSLKTFLKIPRTIDEIADTFDRPPKAVKILINRLKEERYNVIIKDNKVELSGLMEIGTVKKIDLTAFENVPYKFGVVSDNHLNSKYERLDILNAIYDRFQEEGVRDVYHAGNWIDGEARFNKFEIFNHGITPQVEYFVDNYPQRDGITTHYIAGDDHEGWFVQRERIDIGSYTQMMAEKKGRFDLKYLSYIEADIEFKAPKGKAIMKIMHPGGGSAYALSYTPQKIVESFGGGEKPNILIIGHYHKADYMFYRNTHVLQAACTQDQTPFMRKLKIQASLGGWIVEMEQSKDGTINRFKPEYLAFFDKGYYKSRGYYR